MNVKIWIHLFRIKKSFIFHLENEVVWLYLLTDYISTLPGSSAKPVCVWLWWHGMVRGYRYRLF